MVEEIEREGERVVEEIEREGEGEREWLKRYRGKERGRGREIGRIYI